ncbi:cytochrome-c peroxidase [Alcanivorax sp. JB21]|uniref:cytochrome-c peroxidase n=1 Tax=Alcanivorax limicola TaxID=2874102 RepID=UPI001CBC3A6D|nr:cytochrome c peroxidase [Alcanivorax limicola]MBZ2188104.1 cytochrome-c peroxidase [Alcanivorax limicola]
MSCWPAPHVDDGVAWQPLGELPPRADIAPAKRDLGQKLFFDPRLSSSGQIACASCHDPDMGWADGRRLPFGHDRQRGHRNTPSIMNTGYLTHIFWDGRVGSLEEQAKASILNPIEMNATEAQAVRRIAETDGYRPLFEAAFDDDAVTFDRIAGAIADFVRTINTPNTPFDRFLRGDRESLSDAQVRGLHLFRTQARCMNCHSGALFSDETFHHLGTAVYQHSGGYEGRHRVTGAPQDMTAFRVPPLRGTALTGPWMHTGIAPDLRSLLHLYNIGWWQNNALEGQHDDPKFPKLSPLIQPLALSASEISDLEAFLKAISPSPGENRREPPSLP